jgi:hypothetical protein
MHYVTFIVKGRTGNNMFQYLMCKTIQYHFGHVYTPTRVNDERDTPFYVTEENARDVLEGKIHGIKQKNIVCDGYFQQSDLYVAIRKPLLQMLYTSNDSWLNENGTEMIHFQPFLLHPCNHLFQHNDIVISLRLDDFIQLPCKTSDILPPSFYTRILESIGKHNINKVYLICDSIHYEW